MPPVSSAPSALPRCLFVSLVAAAAAVGWGASRRGVRVPCRWLRLRWILRRLRRATPDYASMVAASPHHPQC